ncbi:MAG: helix-turn-helix domain-containing protein [Pseudolabrys sp.]|jgi:predicted DNA-binding transcriptional regulator AlpA
MKLDTTNPDIARAVSRSEQFPLISIQDVAKKYGVSLRTLRRWEAAGTMPARVKHGHRLKYKKTDIAGMMAARQSPQAMAEILPEE